METTSVDDSCNRFCTLFTRGDCVLRPGREKGAWSKDSQRVCGGLGGGGAWLLMVFRAVQFRALFVYSVSRIVRANQLEFSADGNLRGCTSLTKD
jgi:hypothetical protein